MTGHDLVTNRRAKGKTMDSTFVTDMGGFYNLRTVAGVLVVQGARTLTTYTSCDTRLEVTGKSRRHTGVGIGRRAILHLDTGEGMSAIRGVVGG